MLLSIGLRKIHGRSFWSLRSVRMVRVRVVSYTARDSWTDKTTAEYLFEPEAAAGVREEKQVRSDGFLYRSAHH